MISVKVTVKLFASLRENNEKEMLLDFPESITPLDIIQRINISEKDVAIIMINGRAKGLHTIIQDGDTISLFPAVGGG